VASPSPDVLLSRAADLGADLIVSGRLPSLAAARSLARRLSRELLEHMTVPVADVALTVQSARQ